MATIHEKILRLEKATADLQSLLDSGVDPKSKEAAPLGLELIHAADEVGKELGYQILKPIDKKSDFIHPDPAS